MNILKKQLGIGLLELMLSLAIIAILLVMATRYYLVTSTSQKVNETVSIMGGLKSAAENWRQAYPGGYANFDLNTCDENNWFPEQYIAGATTVKTPWGDATLTSAANEITVTMTTTSVAEAKNLYNKLGCGSPDEINTTSVTYNIIGQSCGAGR